VTVEVHLTLNRGYRNCLRLGRHCSSNSELLIHLTLNYLDFGSLSSELFERTSDVRNSRPFDPRLSANINALWPASKDRMNTPENAIQKRVRRTPRPVPTEAYADALALAQQVLQHSVTQFEAEKNLTARYDLGDRVATGYIGNYLSMKRGSPKVRSTIAADGWRFFLDQFEKDGTPDLQGALSVLWEHIEYLAGPEPKLRKVHADYIGRVAKHVEGDPAATRTDRIEASLADGNELRKQRLDLAPKYPEVVLIITQAFKRNADVIAEVLAQAAGFCQACGRDAPFSRRTELHIWRCIIAFPSRKVDLIPSRTPLRCARTAIESGTTA
jgi:hypothetical protein